MAVVKYLAFVFAERVHRDLCIFTFKIQQQKKKKKSKKAINIGKRLFSSSVVIGSCNFRDTL